MTGKISRQLNMTLTLLSSLQEAEKLQNKIQRQRTRSPSPKSPTSREESRMQRTKLHDQASDERLHSLYRSLRLHAEQCTNICRQAKTLGSRVMHELTRTCELFNVSAVLDDDEGSVSTATGLGDSSLSPLLRRESAVRQLSLHSTPSRSGVIDVDDVRLSTGNGNVLLPTGNGLLPTRSVRRARSQESFNNGESESMSMSMAMSILPGLVLKDIMEVPVEECRLDSPERSQADAEVLMSPPRTTQLEASKRHIWQVRAS